MWRLGRYRRIRIKSADPFCQLFLTFLRNRHKDFFFNKMVAFLSCQFFIGGMIGHYDMYVEICFRYTTYISIYADDNLQQFSQFRLYNVVFWHLQAGYTGRVHYVNGFNGNHNYYFAERYCIRNLFPIIADILAEIA